MAEEKKNPLIGAFRSAPAKDQEPPGSKAAEPEKAVVLSKEKAKLAEKPVEKKAEKPAPAYAVKPGKAEEKPVAAPAEKRDEKKPEEKPSAIVRDMDRDSAIIYMVDSNLKRENISPMVKARAYTMKLEAMKRKAGRPTKAQVEAGYKPMRADEQLAQQTGESRATIQRLTRLTKLEPELQDMVEEKKLPVNTAADISYLKPQEQKALADAIKREDKVPSGAKAAELKKESQAGKLTAEKIEQTVAPSKREMFLPLKVTFTEEELRPYFPKKDTTIADAKRVVFEALDLRQRALNRQKAKAEQEKAAKKAAPGKER